VRIEVRYRLRPDSELAFKTNLFMWAKQWQRKKRKGKQKRKSTKREVLVVASKVKAYVKSKEMMTSSDALAALNDKVYAVLDKAVARTKANRRRTCKQFLLY